MCLRHISHRCKGHFHFLLPMFCVFLCHVGQKSTNFKLHWTHWKIISSCSKLVIPISTNWLNLSRVFILFLDLNFLTQFSLSDFLLWLTDTCFNVVWVFKPGLLLAWNWHTSHCRLSIRGGCSHSFGELHSQKNYHIAA